MRKLCLMALLLATAVPGLAGDVNVPGAPVPPPPTVCTENCASAAPADISTLEAIEMATIQILIGLLP